MSKVSQSDVARGFLLYSALRNCVENMIGESKAIETTFQGSLMPINIPVALQSALQNKTATVIACAGISRAAANLVGWEDVLKAAVVFLREHGISGKSLSTIEPLLEDGLYEEAAQVVERWLHKINGKGDFLRKQFHVEVAQISNRAVVEAVWKIAGDVVFTTNYDRILQLCGPGGVETVTWKEPNKMLAAIRGEPSVVHLHGVYNDPDSVIFSASSYALLSDNEGYRSFSQALWTRGPLLFVGASTFGMGDTDFSRLFDWGKRITPHLPFTSYTLQPQGVVSAEEKKNLYSMFKVEVIEYGKQFSELGPFLLSIL